ncbi:unnamed protein product [Trichobilharzia regenti]|nr:unnamed protein product [Trichobilharzia regenti]
MYHQRLPFHSELNISTTKETFVYVPTKFHVNKAYVSTLLRHNGYVASVLSEEFTGENSSSESTFFCTCGRVSDPCICCGVLKPQMSGQNLLSPDLYKPILLKNNSVQPAHFCMNTTYLPNKKQIKTSGVLVNLTSNLDVIPNKFDAGVDKPTKSVIRFTHLSTVFSTLYLPSSPLPVICAGHHQEDYVIDLCVNFTLLEYKFDSDSDHKTVFHGCAFIHIVLNRVFVIAKYPKFCFSAHRGAAGDADQASNKRSNEKVLLNTLSPGIKNSTSRPESMFIVNFSSPINSSVSLSEKQSGPSFQIVKVQDKRPLEPLKDSHELHRGIP